MDKRICGVDDGATVCVLPRGHVLPHESQDGRRFLWVEGDEESRIATWLHGRFRGDSDDETEDDDQGS